MRITFLLPKNKILGIFFCNLWIYRCYKIILTTKIVLQPVG